MVGFGSQIQGVQGDEPGEAVMLDSSGAVPSGGGGLKWTRISANSVLTAGRTYLVFGPPGHAMFTYSNRTPKEICIAETSTNYAYRVTISNNMLDKWRTESSAPGVSDSNTALYILEE